MPATTKPAKKPPTSFTRTQLRGAIREAANQPPSDGRFDDRTAPDLDITRARVLDRALNALRPHAIPEVIDYHRDQARELRVTALPHEAEMLRVADEHEAIAEILDVLRPRGGR
jgi:hypothetical protein